jgi:hypothetical protein
MQEGSVPNCFEEITRNVVQEVVVEMKIYSDWGCKNYNYGRLFQVKKIEIRIFWKWFIIFQFSNLSIFKYKENDNRRKAHEKS